MAKDTLPLAPNPKTADKFSNAAGAAPPRSVDSAQNLKRDFSFSAAGMVNESGPSPFPLGKFWFNPSRLAERAKQKRHQRESASERARQAKEEKLKQQAASRQERLITEQSAAEAARLDLNEEKQRQEKTRRAKNRLRAEKLALKLKAKEERKKLAAERRAARKKAFAKKIKKIKNYFKQRAKRFALTGAAVVVVLIAVVGGLSYLVYSRPRTDNLVTVLVNRLPWPAMIVNGRPIRYSAYLNELRLWSDYYASEVGGEVTDKNRLVREKLVYYNILKKLAVAYGVKINDEEKQAAFKRFAASAGGEEKLIDKIYNEYGLTKETFVDKVVYYQVLAAKIKRTFIADDKLHQGATLRLAKVSALLEKNKDDFETLAQKYSEDIHALQGGDIGYVKTNAMNEALKAAVQNLAAGEVSQVIKEEDKYFIVKVYDRKTNRRQEEEVWLKQITIFTNYDFDEYLADLRARAKIWMLVK